MPKRYMRIVQSDNKYRQLWPTKLMTSMAAVTCRAAY